MLHRLIPCVVLLAFVLTACGEASACPPQPIWSSSGGVRTRQAAGGALWDCDCDDEE